MGVVVRSLMIAKMGSVRIVVPVIGGMNHEMVTRHMNLPAFAFVVGGPTRNQKNKFRWN
jgi:hypothetical protein